MLNTGAKAPEFSLPDQDGKLQSLSAFLESGPLVLYFYPADFTPGCTKEACSIRDIHDELQAAGLRVVGISPQDADSHTRFRSKYNLNFSLLADADKAVIKRYGVDGPLSIGVRRVTYLIGSDGVIRDRVLADMMISRHQDFIRRAARDVASGRGD